jgi:hypothetical protein
MGGGETIADQILKTFALPDVVGSRTSSKKLINLLRGHVLLSTYNLRAFRLPCSFRHHLLCSFGTLRSPSIITADRSSY